MCRQAIGNILPSLLGKWHQKKAHGFPLSISLLWGEKGMRFVPPILCWAGKKRKWVVTSEISQAGFSLLECFSPIDWSEHRPTDRHFQDHQSTNSLKSKTHQDFIAYLQVVGFQMPLCWTELGEKIFLVQTSVIRLCNKECGYTW